LFLEQALAGPTPGIEHSDLIGQTLAGRYIVDSKLGAGGMATVYAAMDQTLGRKIVIKIPHAELLQQPGFRERFIEEVRSLIALEHPHICSIQDYGEVEGVPFAVVAFLSGGDLRAKIDQAGGRLKLEDVCRWLPQIASALDFMHQKGMVHRDIKPDNILFDEQGNVLLSDFGIATVMHKLDPDETQVGQLTKVGSFVGTTAYAPPEAIRRELSGAYDQYSLGVTLYLGLSGEMPILASTPEETLVLKSSQEARPISQIVSDLPEDVAQVIMRSIALDPKRRFASCNEFATALTQAAQPSQPTGSSTRAVAYVGIVVALLAVVAFWMIRTGPDPKVEVVQVDPPGTRFDAGSSPEEISAAMVLCQQYSDSCDFRDFESEILREVRVVDLEADATEVTNANFLEFVEASDHVTTAERGGSSYHEGFIPKRGWSWRDVDGSGTTAKPDHPVVHVSQADATAYCDWVGGRLPSEVEWEFIARGVDRRVFPWGDDWDPERTRWKGAAGSGVQAAGGLPGGATPEGLQDLAGNVWEWTSSRTNAGKAVLKGGAWTTDNPAYLRAAMRLDEAPDFTSDDAGFRCVRER